MNGFAGLREARQAAGLTYREVALKTGLDTSTIAHFEAGRVRPSPDSLVRWRLALKQLMADRAAQIAHNLIQF